MSWRGEEGGIAAAQQHHDVIMTPGYPVYFDLSQSENGDSPDLWGYFLLKPFTIIDPVPKELNDQMHIIFWDRRQMCGQNIWPIRKVGVHDLSKNERT